MNATSSTVFFDHPGVGDRYQLLTDFRLHGTPVFFGQKGLGGMVEASQTRIRSSPSEGSKGTNHPRSVSGCETLLAQRLSREATTRDVPDWAGGRGWMVAQTEATDHPNGHDIPTPPNQRVGTGRSPLAQHGRMEGRW
jgi:hypothetical protein